MLPAGWDGEGGPGPDVHPQISLYDINVELKNSPTAQISMNDYRVRQLAGKPTGVISMNNFYNKYCRVIYRATTYNGTAGANANAYNGGDGEAFNAEIYPNQTDGADTIHPTEGIYTWSGKPSATVSGTLCVAAQALTAYGLIGTLSYSLDGTTYYSMGTLNTSIQNFYVNLTCNPNNLRIKVTGLYDHGGSAKDGTLWDEHSGVRIYDCFFRV